MVFSLIVNYVYNSWVEKAGKLEEALEKYKLSQQFGVERAAVHIRNVCSIHDLYISHCVLIGWLRLVQKSWDSG